MVIKNDLAYFGYIGYIFLVSLPSVFLAFYMNRRRIRLLGLYAPVVFTLCMLKVLESNFSDPEYGSLEAFILMILYGFPLIIGALVYTLIRLCFVYKKNLRKGTFDFPILSYRSSSGLVCGDAISAPSVYIRSHYFDDSGFLSATSLSLLFRQRSVGPS